MASRSSASFSCGSCWVPFVTGTAATVPIPVWFRRMRRGVLLGGSRLRPPTRAPADDDVKRDAGGENTDADQLAGGEVPPGTSRRVADEIEDAAALLVTAHRLDDRAQRRIEHEVEREQLAVESL